MIKSKGSLTDEFKLAKEAGFEGVELNVPASMSKKQDGQPKNRD